MAKVSFRAKVKEVYNIDNTLAYRYVPVPELKRAHCDMAAFRQHPKFSGLANSDLFQGILRRQREAIFGASGMLRLDRIPEGVTVDTSGFLAAVSFDL